MARTALAANDPDLAVRLADHVFPRFPLEAHALLAARAAIAEHERKLERAAATYGRAAEAWLEFGHLPERAAALFGQGRCLAALGDPAAAQPLQQARELFSAMGYKPALCEVEALSIGSSLWS